MSENSSSTPATSTSRTRSKRTLPSPDNSVESDLKKNKLIDVSGEVSSEVTTLPIMSAMEEVVSSDQPVSATGPLSPEARAEIQATINTAVKEAVKEAFALLKQEFTDSVVVAMKEEIAGLKAENTALQGRVARLERAADSAEQYSRRNCLRITGIKESNTEVTDDLVVEMASALGVDMVVDEIDRSHRVGRVIPDDKRDPRIPVKPRAIIVKFTSYRSRNRLYRARAKAKSIPQYSGVYINEDLTQTRNNLLYECRKLVKSSKLLGAWSSDGNILVKDSRSRVHKIIDISDLAPYMS